MTVHRLILPNWAKEEDSSKRSVLEGQFTEEEIIRYNNEFYNIYYLPNYPSHYDGSSTVDGSHIDIFEYVYVDMDLKDKIYASKEEFLENILSFALEPTEVVDSGNGVHVYWRVSDLTAENHLKLQRRLIRHFKTDDSVAKIYQLMRLPNTVNTKHKDSFKHCYSILTNSNVYTSEQLDKELPYLTKEDELYCKQHFDKTYNINRQDIHIVDKIPLKFAELIRSNNEVKEIWSGNLQDRSKGDYRLAHIMFASGFTKEEASSVLVNSSKALARAPIHRISYATNIIDKIWIFELETKEISLSSTVEEILNRSGDTLKGTRFPCWTYLDNTYNGFRLGQVIGLVAGSGVGKTAVALNMFLGFVQNNPDYDHMFVSLEQPVNEIADRWKVLCGENTKLHSKVHLLSNYDENGNFRDLSLDTIKNHVLELQEKSGKKLGCVVIDHIGVLSNDNRLGQDEGVKKLCKAMKVFAVQTNTMLIMQSQTSREKAGIGDLELNKDAAFGTSVFENFCDYLITVWQPLKRCYDEDGCPTVTAFKFCKIRHKKANLDVIKEDKRYTLFFDPNTDKLREMTQTEEKSFDFFNNKATNKRKQDRKTDVMSYTSVRWDDKDGKSSSN